MAGRGHVDVIERRLRPIYDCLDHGNSKKALQEAEKVLRKQKDLPCARALKACALLRLGRHDESMRVLRELHGQNPTDEATLQAMSFCYRDAGQIDLIADMYENAHKAKPENEEILSALFMSYVRMANYKKQQQVAMTLHRLRPNKNPYYFWAIMSIIMQANSADEKLAKTMFLPLAERMTQKYVKEDKIEEKAEVYLYLIILELMGKYQEALEVVQGPLGEKLTSEMNFPDVKIAELYTRMEKWPEMNAYYRQLLSKNPDHWQFYLEYFKSFFSLIDAGWNEDGDNKKMCVDNTVDKVLQFLQEQIERVKDEVRPVRGPYLAQLELRKQLQARNSSEVTKLDSALELLKRHFLKFGDKNCCFYDMAMFIGLLENEETEQLIQTLHESLGLGEITLPSDIKCLQRHITLVQLARYSGLHDKLPVEDKLQLVKELIHRYTAGLSFGEGLLSTELQFSDPYLHIVVNILFQLWKSTGECAYLWQAIVVLEKGLQTSPSNFQLKLLIIRLYALIGAFGPCFQYYESMEFKHIQNDSSGYIVTNHMGRLGHFSSAIAVYESMLKFFTLNDKETTECLITSYKYGYFTKISEFVKFRDKLENSLQFTSATVERLLLDLTLESNSHQRTEQLVHHADIDPSKEKTVWEDQEDNRDLKIIVTSEPPHRTLTEELRAYSFDEEKAWLKLRNLQVCCLAAAVKLGHDRGKSASHTNNSLGTDDNKKSMAEVLSERKAELASHLTCCQRFATPPDESFTYPSRTRLSTYLSLSLGSLLGEFFNLVLYVHKIREEGVGKCDEKEEERTKTALLTQVDDLIKGSRKHSVLSMENDQVTFHAEVLEQLVLLAESLSQWTVMLGVCCTLLKPLKTSLVKKGKKKKEAASTLPCIFSNVNSIVSGMEESAEELLKAVGNIDLATLTVDLNSLKLAASQVLDGCEDIEKQVWKKVETSYERSAKEVTSLVQHKLEYLKSLKL